MARVKEKPAARGVDGGQRGPQVIFQFGAGLPVQSMTLVGGGGGDSLPAGASNEALVSIAPPSAVGAFGLPAEVFSE
jgi:hypothetical protein